MLNSNISYLSLSELCSRIKSAIDAQFAGMQYWVVGEIAGFSDSRGHCYITFVEKSANRSTPDAEIRAVIFKSRYQQIKSVFETQTGTKLKEGIRILFSTTVNFDAKYGISLVVNDIEPGFTLGLMQMERKQIIEKLKQEGIYDKNRSLILPPVIQNIAVLSAEDSRGYLDFRKTLLINKFAFSYLIDFYPVALQGENASKETVEQLIRIFQSEKPYDAVILVRGGGGNANLDVFNNYAMARAVARFPIPIITGIGHVTDLSIVDEVSNQHCITPTDAANFLLEHNERFLQQINDDYSRIIGHLSYITASEMQTNENRLMRLQSMLPALFKDQYKNLQFRTIRLSSQTHRLTDNREHLLQNQISGLRAELKDFFKTEKSDLKSSLNQLSIGTERFENSFYNQLNSQKEALNNKPQLILKLLLQKNEAIADKIRILDPQNILKRGYSITLCEGKLLKSSKELTPGQSLRTILFDGEVESVVK